jgi:diaminohydroxyphosphoribosylaminopyrimidine deaminase / 5-amino-6-(5-phosphoribosylamino)uracil reductase
LTGQSTTPEDSKFLSKALALAEGGRGRVSPNPLVGAIVVRGGEVIGEGFHAVLGGLHAERAALADAARRGEDTAGATMYLTLEPCAHQGRQPPCSDAVIEAGIARVVIATDDPTSKAAGKGPAQLREAGVEVEFVPSEDDLALEARLQNQSFRKHGRTGIPWVMLKTAMSLDGRTTTPEGVSPWISSESARELVHVWRGECDAIAVGIGTVLADDPLLTARLGEARQPVRVVFDSHARLPLDSQLLATLDQSPVIVVAGPEAPRERIDALKAAGADPIVATDATPTARVTTAVRMLGRQRGISSLMLEGGATLAAAFAAAGEVDEARVFVAPLILGGPLVDVPIAGLQGTLVESKTVGEDTLIRTRFKEW